MMSTGTAAERYEETANERFKKSYRSTVAIGIATAVVAHFALFELFPRMQAKELGAAVTELSAIELPPEVRIPPPPDQIARPATPKVAAAEIEEDVTIAPTTFESNPVENLPPQLRNKKEVLAFLKSTYPSMLKQAGVGGTVLLWLYIDEVGQVQRTVVAESSGYEQLDDAAKKVAERMQFKPAMNRDKRTAVWLAQSIDFSVT
jgi:TonB family protein